MSPSSNGNGPSVTEAWHWPPLDAVDDFEARLADLSRMRPVEFAWSPWMPRGRLTNMVGEEGVGKSTFTAYVVAGLTTGALPGLYFGQPKDVLFVGADEDDFDTVTLPRLYAAGADLDHVRVLEPRSDARSFDIERHSRELARTLERYAIGLVVFEHLMDILPPMRSYTDPAALRRACLPLRRVLAASEVAGLGTLHANKAEAQSFRQRAQGSVQFGAMARSAFLLDRHPKNRERRVAILGKANYVKGSAAVGFDIEEHLFTYNGQPFAVGRAVNVYEEALSMADVLAGGPSPRARQQEEARLAILDLLAEGPKRVPELEPEVPASRPTIYRLLRELQDEEAVETVKRGVWSLSQVSAPIEVRTETNEEGAE